MWVIVIHLFCVFLSSYPRLSRLNLEKKMLRLALCEPKDEDNNAATKGDGFENK